ncbi:DUF1003 domain-containing protein [uncultured Pseudoteredinibacter sp.]|uniref:DUF1003 domain-containing protein n=1 Tax=uncultured Pseudoteredinibacter sp. TaxID=1641701 RepID=UPI002612F260|nr:DUF1003 domain-containing protein [uncultured Pseudoteredinibacter sp.]
MKKYFENLAKALLGQPYKELSSGEQKVIESIAEKTSVSEDINETFEEGLTFGQIAADKIAAFGGSWTFIGIFFAFIMIWIVLNTGQLLGLHSFDPYPYILLNLGLSSLAAFQAPIIMMSQNRQSSKDRLQQQAAFEVNLKLELELKLLHEKFDRIEETLEKKWNS